MARQENPPFSRGETIYNGATIDTADLMGADILGKEWVFEDIDPTDPTVRRTSRYVRCRLVRNVGAIALLPKRMVRFQATAGDSYGAEVDGYTTTTGERGYPLDEWLPSAGLLVNDVGWIVVEGPAVVVTALANGQGNSIAVGDPLMSLTAATSGATTAGRASMQFILGAATSGNTDYITQFNEFRNYVGRALSARTTNETDLDVLLEVGKW